MGIFSRKPKVVREIHDGAWGHLVNEHKIDVDTISRDIRCVEREGGRGQASDPDAGVQAQ